MVFFLVILGCLLFYRTSKYFPQEIRLLSRPIYQQKNVLNVGGSILLVISAILSSLKYGTGTGLLVFFALVMFSLCLILIVVPLNKKLVYLFVGISVIFMLIDNLL